MIFINCKTFTCVMGLLQISQILRCDIQFIIVEGRQDSLFAGDHVIFICRASARPPASQSTAPHFPSSLDGIRNRKGSKWSRPSELINRTAPSKSDTAQFGT